MATLLVRLCAAQVILAAITTVAGAQHLPGAPQIDWERTREEYRAEVLKEYQGLMLGWRSAWQNGDAQQAANFYTESAVLVVTDSAPMQGKRVIQEYFTRALPRVVEIRLGLTDFVASDRLAYALSPIWYRERAESGEVRVFTGTCVTVLVREGRHWKIRSQVFRFWSGG